ncbi:hypothetical protein FB451DRAFT_1045455, partial [Mycena latifolia]
KSASIFLQQKLNVAGPEERGRIVDAICARGGEVMMHRFRSWAVQHCLEAATGPEKRRKIVACMGCGPRGGHDELHVLQKAPDCAEEVRLLIVSALRMGDPAQQACVACLEQSLSRFPSLSVLLTLVLIRSWGRHERRARRPSSRRTSPCPFSFVGRASRRSASARRARATRRAGTSLPLPFSLSSLSFIPRRNADSAMDSKPETLEASAKDERRGVWRAREEPAARVARRAMIVDLALSLMGSQLIASVLPTTDKEQRVLLYECIRGHIVTLHGCKTGSKVIWLLYIHSFPPLPPRLMLVLQRPDACLLWILKLISLISRAWPTNSR